MSATNHPWCRDVRRDEQVRAAEDAAAVPAIQHRDLPEQVALVWASLGDLIGRVVRLEGEFDAGQDEEAAPAVCDSASPAEGLRTEGWLTAEEREASTEAMKCMTKFRRERDEANAECERLRVAHLKAALERDRANEARGRIRSEWTRRGQALHAAQQAIGDLNARVAELEAAAPPRGWLTAEEREAVEMFIRMGEEHDDVDAECAAMKLRALLAREAPPRVKVPPVNAAWVDFLHERDGKWIAAIRAAGGEVE